MSVIQATCPSCHATLKIKKPELAGKKIRCPKCQGIVTVPQASPITSEPVKKARAKATKSEKPESKEVSNSKAIVLASLGAVAIVGLLGGGYFIFISGGASTKRSASTPKIIEPPPPEPIPSIAAGEQLKLDEAVRTAQAREKTLIEKLSQTEPALQTAIGGRLLELLDDFGSVDGVAFSPDGKHLVGSGEGGVRMWNLETAQNEWKGPQARYLKEVAFSPDGKQIATAWSPGISLWDRATHQRSASFKKVNGLIMRPRFSPDGRLLVGTGSGSAIAPHALRVWNLSTKQPIPEFSKDAPASLDASFRGDGKVLAVLDKEKGILFLDPKSARLVDPTRGRIKDLQRSFQSRKLTHFAYSPDGQWLAVAFREGQTYRVVLTNLDQMKQKNLSRVLGAVTVMRFSPDSKLLAIGQRTTGDLADRITFWDALAAAKVATIRKTPIPTDLAFSPGGTLLAVCAGKSVTVWNVPEILKPLRTSIALLQPEVEIRRTGWSYHALLKEQADDAKMKELLKIPRLVAVRMPGNRKVTATGFAALQKMPHLQYVDFTNMPQLSDAHLAQLRGLTRLKSVTMNGPNQVTDAGLASVSGNSHLEFLWISQSQVTAKGLQSLKGLKHLKSLQLGGLDLRGEGWGSIATLTALQDLRMPGAKLANDDLAHLKNLQQLQVLDLSGTPISDQGVMHLQSLKNLKQLDLTGTGVTAEGKQKLRTAIAGLSIVEKK